MTQETLFRLVEAFDAGTMTRLEYCEGEAKLVLERTVCAPAPIPAAMPAVPMAAAPAAPMPTAVPRPKRLHSPALALKRRWSARFTQRRNRASLPLSRWAIR